MATRGGKEVSLVVSVDARQSEKGFKEVKAGALSTEQAIKRLSTQARASGAELDRAFSGNVSLDPFTESVARATNGLGALSTRLQGIPAALGRFGGAVGLGAGAIAAGVLAMAKAAAEAGREVGELSMKTGVGAESVSRLNYAVKATGGTTGALESGLQSLSSKMQSAAQGGKASAAMFAQLGIEVTRSDGALRGADEVFLDLAQRLSELPAGLAKTEVAVALLGSSAGELGPALNEGRAGLEALSNEADRFGLTISESAAAAALEFNQNLERLQGLVQGVVVQIGGALIPALSQFATDFLRAGEAGLSFGQALLSIGLSNPFSSAEEHVRSLTGKLAELEKRRASALDWAGGRPEASALLPQIEAEISLRQKELAYWTSKVKDAQGPADTSAEKQRAAERLQIQQQLSAEMVRLDKLRETAAKSALKEEIQGAQLLGTALREAWKSSTQAAQQARKEAAAFFSQGEAALNSRNVEANQRAAANNAASGNSGQNYRSASALIDEASKQATFAQNAAIDGRAGWVKKSAEEALRLSKEAAEYVRGLGDDPSAVGLLRRIGEAEKQALDAQGVQREKEASSQEEAANAIAAELQSAEQRLATLKASLAEPVNIAADVAQAEASLDALKTRLDALKDKTVTVTVKTVENGAAPAGDIPGLWTGGPVRGPGTGTSDSILAYLSNGEYVLRAAAVRHYGLSRLNRINQLSLPRFAAGGLATSASRPTQSVMSSGAQEDRSGGTPITLDFGRLGSFQTSAQEDVAAQILKTFQLAASQRGRRK